MTGLYNVLDNLPIPPLIFRGVNKCKIRPQFSTQSPYSKHVLVDYRARYFLLTIYKLNQVYR